eukprot:Em0001g315a
MLYELFPSIVKLIEMVSDDQSIRALPTVSDARPQRFQVCDHWGHTIDHWDDFMQEPLNDLDEMSEEVDINGPLTFDDDLLNNNDDIRKNSESLTFQVRMR